MKDFLKNFIEDNYFLNRTAVNEDTDKLVSAVQKELNCNILEVPSGKECLTWIIPKHWKVNEAYLARTNGEKVIEFSNNPLHLWTHSIPFKGTITKQELDNHLYYSKEQPDWIPYHYKNGYNYFSENWGFSLSYKDYLKLNDENYYVHIDAELNNSGTMKVIDYKIDGKNKDTIFFAAHTCHPAQVADGLSNVALLICLFKYLASQSNLNYSYRLILGPEYFAAAGFLAEISEEEIYTLKAGIYLDMLGNGQILGYQASFQGNSHLDKIVKNVFKHYLPEHIEKNYREFVGNDEMFYNGPGFYIPTIGISNKKRAEYHYHTDKPDTIDYNQLINQLELLKKIILLFELDYIPVRKFKGPLYLSKYNLYIDRKTDSTGYLNLERIQILMDGNHSCFEIADKLGINFTFVYEFCNKLLENNLISKKLTNIFSNENKNPWI